MLVSGVETPNLVPMSTQSDPSSSTLALSSLDIIAMTPQAMSLLNVRPSEDSAISDDNTSHPPEHRLRLYEAMWHQQAGLIVSPNVSYIPRRLPQDTKDGHRQRKYSQPGLLRDDELYLAFQPRFARNEGALFGRLNLTREALSENICQLQNGRFILPDDIIFRWSRLEIALLDVADVLLSAKHDLPRLTYPHLPWQCGYRDAHASRDTTLRCALRARDAFLELSAIVSFALSLHMDDSGEVSRAFMLVRQRSTYKPVRAWFDLLAESYVCNFSPNFRVGGFANVPIWVFWGHFHKITYPLDAAAFKYSPPDKVIENAKARAAVTSTLILPIYRYDPFAMSHGNPIPAAADVDGDVHMGANDLTWETTPLPQTESVPDALAPIAPPPETESLHDEESNAACKAKALAALEEYFESLERVRERHIKAEKPREKQQRESWELYARTHYRFSNKCKVYEWRKLSDGTYERVKINSVDFGTVWNKYTRNQQRFVGHANTWELCPQLPRYSEEHRKEDEPWTDARSDYYSEDEVDDEDEAPVAPTTSLKLPNKYGAMESETVYIDDLHELGRTRDGQSTTDQLNASHVEQFDFTAFVKGRFGYNIFSPAGWNSKFAPSPKTKNITIKNAKLALSFDRIPGGRDVEDAVINLVKTLSNATWSFRDLPSAFDHSSDRGISLVSDTLQFSIVSSDENSLRFIVFKKGYLDKCPWGIYTSDASTVLLIFRMKWGTMDIIARELVARGVPFHTVLAAEAAPKTAPLTPTRGLGERPMGYQPAKEDYMEYLRRREELLNGSKGRAALMRGGIVARIARDVLDHHIVLDGPSSDAVTVGKHRRFNLYDDDLTENDLDLICGVYYVDVESPPIVKTELSTNENFVRGTKAHMSFWPKDATWTAMGAYLRMEWTEKAEIFYQKRLAILETKLDLMGASTWRSVLRVQNVVTKEIEEGAEHYQAGYLEHCHRQSRFIAT